MPGAMGGDTGHDGYRCGNQATVTVTAWSAQLVLL